MYSITYFGCSSSPTSRNLYLFRPGGGRFITLARNNITQNHITSAKHIAIANIYIAPRANTTLVPTSPACRWWNHPEEDLASSKLESTPPTKTVVKLIEVFYGVESVVCGNADSLLNSPDPITTHYFSC